jgi:hypothetical protein
MGSIGEIKRQGQDKNTLWDVFNRCQESLIRGGFYASKDEKNYRKVRALKSVNSQVKINQEFWAAAESMAA